MNCMKITFAFRKPKHVQKQMWCDLKQNKTNLFNKCKVKRYQKEYIGK